MAKYRKKPVVVEAVRFFDTAESLAELSEFMGTDIRVNYADPDSPTLIIPTLEGDHIASVGDYIIKGIKGEFYPCKPDIFEQTYEKVDSKNLNHRSKECIKYIAKITGVDEETVIKVLRAEDEYVRYILKVISREEAR